MRDNNHSQTLKSLKKITRELAEEIHDELHYDSDSVFQIVTLLLDHMPVLCEIVTPEHEIIFVNKHTKNHVKRMGGVEPQIGGTCFTEMFGVKDPCKTCPLDKAIRTGEVCQVKFLAPGMEAKRRDQGMGGTLTAIPLKWNGTSAVILIGKSPAEEMKVDCDEPN